ncbi:MAG: hypothetical protein Q8P31_13905, partial [Bacillota bacterium]|nr:hypothetical protein [Bacillota bacterium]
MPATSGRPPIAAARRPAVLTMVIAVMIVALAGCRPPAPPSAGQGSIPATAPPPASGGQPPVATQ